MNIVLDRISDKQEFMNMALDHFRELNPEFKPATDWRRFYFESIQNNSDCSLCWILADGVRVGFVLYGIETHRFLPRRIGFIYELYVLPEQRRKGIAKMCAQNVIREFRKCSLSKIQLEIVEGNPVAERLWSSVGFSKISEKFAIRAANIKV